MHKNPTLSRPVPSVGTEDISGSFHSCTAAVYDHNELAESALTIAFASHLAYHLTRNTSPSLEGLFSSLDDKTGPESHILDKNRVS